MPTKYTLEQVKNIFEQNNCLLKNETYDNQLGKLNYVASCGHNNTISLKLFLNGNGNKCKNCAFDIPSYETIEAHFTSKDCQLCYTKEEFETYYINNKQKLTYIASCGHKNEVCWKNFNGLNQGTNCPSCVNKNTGIKLKEFRTGENKNSLQQEYNNIAYFRNMIDHYFKILKTFDGCKADIAIQKFNEINDLWLGIQVKTTIKKTDRNQYYFRLNNGKYDNCILLCICDEDKKMWLIPYEEVKGLKTIGIAQKSKYSKYEVDSNNIVEKLNNYYELCIKLKFDILDTPTSNSQKQEQEYRKIRETKIDFIEFKNNDIEGLVYDFMIGNKKVQEKVGTICKNNINSYSFSLCKYDCRINGKCKNKSYEEGDNDLYWLNCKNGKFYVIPEEVLCENGYIGKYCKKEKLYVSQTNQNTEWSDKYLFDYDNIDKTRLLQIIENNYK
jgi:hypothetical protein